MPELPDVVVYTECLERRIVGRELARIRLASPFLLRSVDPPLVEAFGREVKGLRRLGKRIVLALGFGLFLVLHLMIAGRLRWRKKDAPLPKKSGLAAFDFEGGTLILTEAGSKRRARMHLVRGEDGLAEHDPGGVEPLDATLDAFRAALSRENHTLKRALTDQGIVSGIGNAYSDEILHHALMSPFKQTSRMTDEEWRRLHDATRATLGLWIERTRQDVGDGFPDRVTAFRKGMAAHGRFGEPCPVCGTPIQRIVYASKESNYCPGCQTGGRLLADRALSQLLRKDWPKTLTELETRRRTGRSGPS
ncbi:MAG: formamidopyrimidine-DNA glycosylase [Acidobacteriota bacterium]|nr:formamidopyrimidine-DNA glycosylase [Acidobacteriota bacterium]